jgi:hypothetical protein
MKTAEPARFWEPGFSIFNAELARGEKNRLAPINDALKKTADPVAKERLKKEAAAVKAEFAAKRENARYSLFAAR